MHFHKHRENRLPRPVYVTANTEPSKNAEISVLRHVRLCAYPADLMSVYRDGPDFKCARNLIFHLPKRKSLLGIRSRDLKSRL